MSHPLGMAEQGHGSGLAPLQLPAGIPLGQETQPEHFQGSAGWMKEQLRLAWPRDCKLFLLFSWRKLLLPWQCPGRDVLQQGWSSPVPPCWASATPCDPPGQGAELSRGQLERKGAAGVPARAGLGLLCVLIARNSSLLEQGCAPAAPAGTGTAVLPLPTLPPSSNCWTFLGIHCRRHHDNADG